jgi:serine protease
VLKARLIALAFLVALLTACAGGGGTLPVTTQPAAPAAASRQPASPPAQAQDDEYQLIAPFQARNRLTGELDRILPPNGSIAQIGGNRKSGGSSVNNLVYNGGAVQTSPHLYVVFWGSSWNSAGGDPDGVGPASSSNILMSFYNAISGSSWLATVTQYSQISGSLTSQSWNDSGNPPAHPKQSDLAAEATKAAAHFNDYTVNASYVIALPHGVKPSGFPSSYCAYHTTTSAAGHTIAWTNLPYMPDGGSGCGAYAVGSVTDGVTLTAGHEQAETETDPQPNTGWLDKNGQEIGDKCAWVSLTNSAVPPYATQPLWSNATSSCVQSYP